MAAIKLCYFFGWYLPPARMDAMPAPFTGDDAFRMTSLPFDTTFEGAMWHANQGLIEPPRIERTEAGTVAAQISISSVANPIRAIFNEPLGAGFDAEFIVARITSGSHNRRNPGLRVTKFTSIGHVNNLRITQQVATFEILPNIHNRDRGIIRRWSDEEQRRLYNGDDALKQVRSLIPPGVDAEPWPPT